MDEGVAQYEPCCPFRMRRGKEHRRQTRIPGPEDDGPLGAGSIHDNREVVGLDLERRNARREFDEQSQPRRSV